MDSKSLLESPWLRRELIPDPYNIVGFALSVGTLVSHLGLAAVISQGRSYLWSESLPLEVLGHAWLILGPPFSVYLGVRSLLVARNSLLPLVTVPLGLFLTVLTLVGLSVSFFFAA